MTRHLAVCVICLRRYRATWPGLSERQIHTTRPRGRRCGCGSRHVVALLPARYAGAR